MSRASLWLGVLAACTVATAQPAPQIVPVAVPPQGWQPLPEAAAAMPATGVAPLLAAWGDPADGCYAAWYGDRARGSLASEHAGLAAPLAALGVADLPTLPAGATQWQARAPFSQAALRGTLTLRLDAQAGGWVALSATACASNERQPERCARACETLAGTAPP